MSETSETLSNPLEGSVVEHVNVYPTGMQVMFKGGHFLTVWSDDYSPVTLEIYGKDPPGSEMMRETWEADIAPLEEE